MFAARFQRKLVKESILQLKFLRYMFWKHFVMHDDSKRTDKVSCRRCLKDDMSVVWSWWCL